MTGYKSVIFDYSEIEQEYSDVLISMSRARIEKIKVRDGCYHGESEVLIFFTNGATLTIHRCIIENGVITCLKDYEGNVLDTECSICIECN